MKVVVDTNIVFSALLSKNSKLLKIFFNSKLEFFAPLTLKIELMEKLDKIYKYSKEPISEVNIFLLRIFSKIEFTSLELIPKNTFQRAYEICKDYDEDDTPFVALSMFLEAKYWTGDKIKQHLIKNGFSDFLEY